MYTYLVIKSSIRDKGIYNNHNSDRDKGLILTLSKKLLKQTC